MTDDLNLVLFGLVFGFLSVMVTLKLFAPKVVEWDRQADDNKGELAANSIVVSTDETSEHQDSERINALEQQCTNLLQELRQLQQQCFRLRDELQNQKTQITADWQELTFEQLQSLLVNYPTLQKLVQNNSELPAGNVIALLTPLDNLLHTWDIEPIGQVWEQVPYNPQYHQSDSDDIEAGELVYIRFVGYQQRGGDRILCPAKVSRTLPHSA